MSARAAERWTPARIRKAIRCPKPEGAINRVRDFEVGVDWWKRRPRPTELTLLRWIAANADVVSAPLPTMVYDNLLARQGEWLLIPMPAQLLEVLAAFEADLADIEDEGGAEPDHDGEDELGAAEEVDQRDAWRLSGDREGNLGSPDGIIDQRGWNQGEDDNECEPDHDLEMVNSEDDAHGRCRYEGAPPLLAEHPVTVHRDLSEWRKV